MKTRYLPALLLLAMIATCVEVDISVPSFPQIAAYFSVSESWVQLTITVNFIAYCLGALFYGPISDAYGRRATMLYGNSLLALGAIGCVFAPNIDFLLLSRFIQGIGASTSVVLVFAIIMDVYEGHEAMRLIGMINGVLSMSMAGAPVLGGVINQLVGWRGNYASVAILCCLSWVLLYFYLQESKPTRERFDLRVVMAHFGQLLKSPRYLTASFSPSMMFAAYMAYISASAFLYQIAFGLPTLAFVIHQALIIASFSVTSLYAGAIIGRIGNAVAVKTGFGLCAASLIMLVILGLHAMSPYTFTALMSVFGIGFAIFYPILFADSMHAVANLQGPSASLTMSIRAMLVSVSTGLMGYVYNGTALSVSAVVLVGVLLSTVIGMCWLNQSIISEDPAQPSSNESQVEQI